MCELNTRMYTVDEPILMIFEKSWRRNEIMEIYSFLFYDNKKVDSTIQYRQSVSILLLLFTVHSAHMAIRHTSTL